MMVWALYERQPYPTPDTLLEEYQSETEARDNLRVLRHYGHGVYYIRQQEETHTPWLENADSFCYGITD